jgi:deoxyribodipyrimidine photolyase-related protein
MIEAPGEGAQVWSHKARIALFLSAMRHFCNEVHRRDWPYTYVRLDDMADRPGFQARLLQALQDLRPQSLVVCEPGEWRLLCAVQDAARDAGVPWQVLPDTHFMCPREEFARWAGHKKELRMEFFYRDMRRRHGVLMNAGQPEGGQWNFDADNRKGWPAGGPGHIPEPAWFEPDRITRQVFELVERHFPDHPGALDSFRWPVTREQALQALQRFMDVRLPHFGPQQDAMWTNTPWGWHALLATSLNLHLLDPREVIAAAETAYRERGLDLARRGRLHPTDPGLARIHQWRVLAGHAANERRQPLQPHSARLPRLVLDGPTRAWPACATWSARRWSTATRTTSSGSW